jgi:hypothetical protein
VTRARTCACTLWQRRVPRHQQRVRSNCPGERGRSSRGSRETRDAAGCHDPAWPLVVQRRRLHRIAWPPHSSDRCHAGWCRALFNGAVSMSRTGCALVTSVVRTTAFGCAVLGAVQVRRCDVAEAPHPVSWPAFRGRAAGSYHEEVCHHLPRACSVACTVLDGGLVSQQLG